MLSKLNEAIALAYRQGYRVKKGKVISPFRKKNRALYLNTQGYLCFSTSFSGRIPVHKLVAYEKYGNKLFDKGIEVRHLDGISTNNNSKNIGIGNHQDNMLDLPKEERVKYGVNASSHIRKFTSEEITNIRNYHKIEKSYKKTMEKFNIPSKGSLWYVLNNDYKTSFIAG